MSDTIEFILDTIYHFLENNPKETDTLFDEIHSIMYDFNTSNHKQDSSNDDKDLSDTSSE